MRISEINWKLISAMCIDAVLIFFLFHERTNIALRSPWELVSPIFICGSFACTTLLLFFGVRSARSKFTWCALFTHSALLYGIAFITFRFGFGYDPIIHQAAENFIVQHKKILPLGPLYFGQYALVAAIHFITHMPVWLIDRALVPVLATLTIPPIVYVGLRRGYEISEQPALAVSLALALLPFPIFTFTVPYNLAALYALWCIFLLPTLLRTNSGRITLLLISSAAALTHPLIGVPIAIAIACAYMQRKCTLVCMLAIGVSLPALLMLRGAIFSWPHFENIISVFSFHYSLTSASVWQHTLYYFEFCVPIFIFLYGAWIAREDSQKNRSLFALAAGLSLAIFFIAACITIPGIIPFEQNEFVLRIKNFLPLIFLPPLLAYFARKKIHAATVFCVALAGAAGFYFTYPRLDGVMHPGWNVSSDDITAIQKISRDAAHKQYIILGDALTSAVTLRELGFDARVTTNDGATFYPAAIGPTEPLYPLAQKILNDQLDPDEIHALAQKIHGPIFVAVHDYWFRADTIRDEARIAGADKTLRFDGITVFEFSP